LLSADAGKGAKISNSGIASKLIANRLETVAQDKHGLTAGAWARTEDKDLAA